MQTGHCFQNLKQQIPKVFSVFKNIMLMQRTDKNTASGVPTYHKPNKEPPNLLLETSILLDKNKHKSTMLMKV